MKEADGGEPAEEPAEESTKNELEPGADRLLTPELMIQGNIFTAEAVFALLLLLADAVVQIALLLAETVFARLLLLAEALFPVALHLQGVVVVEIIQPPAGEVIAAGGESEVVQLALEALKDQDIILPDKAHREREIVVRSVVEAEHQTVFIITEDQNNTPFTDIIQGKRKKHKE